MDRKCLSLSGISAHLTEGCTDSLTVATFSAFQDVGKSTAHSCSVLKVRCLGILALLGNNCSLGLSKSLQEIKYKWNVNGGCVTPAFSGDKTGYDGFRSQMIDPSSMRWAEALSVTVHDLVGDKHEYNLDEHRDTRKPTLTLWLKRTGASYVRVFDPIARKPFLMPGKTAQGPLLLVHVDLALGKAVEGVRFDLGPQANELMKGRFRVIHAWRPLKSIYKDLFVVADVPAIP
ncbi:uncharacterized protein NECHADRAFT_84190 [Fusarium vanettenii 77-13-4]|uniref:Uncharacterized protein n=1 Tax=Fusarium vanettenii (strain ATCC MYA-4622 / CBS 123669 / FGSC 9596 / NRRL 45880 / 77-13-4) TaxID=660122 RepID=C7YZY9_FUSV7|nr:uncharacterized protein NECHADRAFT_84190 [Fusarium vanettenii 77-13-4]EEU42695.1 hypothetical protein NECHADRAFT_84190 [Fusarium vanettenii 77-13-4]